MSMGVLLVKKVAPISIVAIASLGIETAYLLCWVSGLLRGFTLVLFFILRNRCNVLTMVSLRWLFSTAG